MSTETTLHSFSDITSNLVAPKVTEIDGVIFRTTLLSDPDKVKQRIDRMMSWLPVKVWAVIKELGIELVVPDNIAEASSHSDVRWYENGDRVLVTVDPAVLFTMKIDKPFNASKHMIAFFRATAGRARHGNIDDREVEVRILSTLYASHLREQGVKIDIDKFVEKSVTRVRRIERLEKLGDKTAALVKSVIG